MVIFDKMKEHVKHPPLVKRAGGQFHRHEWSLHGCPCGPVAEWAKQLMLEVQQQSGLEGIWIDASHSTESAVLVSSFTRHTARWEGQLPVSESPFALRSKLSGAAFALLNGNHFTAARQLVILDPAKMDSLERKLDQLQEVMAFIRTSPQQEIWPYLQSIPKYSQIPVFSKEDLPAIAALLLKEVETVPVLKGLVLAGGQSQRMGEDKSRIAYHGLPQREYVANLLYPFCEEVYLSARPEQSEAEGPAIPVLKDSFTGLGPLGAILTAMRHDPNAAWLVAACDLPLLDAATIQALVQARAPHYRATAYRAHSEAFPEPMLSIWEPAAYSELLQQLAHGWSCPRKYLLRAQCHIMNVSNPAVLTNANTPEERDQAMAQIKATRQEF